jgi:cytochrome c
MIRRIALLLFFPMAMAHAAGDAAAGKRAFAKCASCHQVGPSARSGFGPHLRGIVGRPAAAAKDFRYSQAMRGSGIVWSEARLRAFLKAPDKLVPGNSMRFWGIGSDAEIDDLLAYLHSAEGL